MQKQYSIRHFLWLMIGILRHAVLKIIIITSPLLWIHNTFFQWSVIISNGSSKISFSNWLIYQQGQVNHKRTHISTASPINLSKTATPGVWNYHRNDPLPWQCQQLLKLEQTSVGNPHFPRHFFHTNEIVKMKWMRAFQP